MTELDLQLTPDLPDAPAMLVARERRALVTSLGGGRPHDAAVSARPPLAERRLRATDTAPSASLPELAGGPARAANGVEGLARAGVAGRPGAGAPGQARSPAEAGARTGAGARANDGAFTPAAAPTAAASPQTLRLDDALVVPAGALMRGYLRCRALLLVGDIVGNVHCTAGPVVIRAGARLKGRLVANGDVYVCGMVGDSGGGAVITTSGKLTLAPGARVDGDVRSGRLDLYDGAMLRGVAKASAD